MAERRSGDNGRKRDMDKLAQDLGEVLERFLARLPAAAEEHKQREGRDETKRAICLAGGGPAAGLHIGVLEGLRNHGIRFNNPDSVWALSCIGAWVGVIYNQAQGDKLEETKRFFRDVFREDKSFESFPVNKIFSTDWFGNAEAMSDFLLEPRNYRNAILPREIMKSFFYTVSAMRRMGAARFRRRGDVWHSEFAEFNEGDFNRWTLNHALAVNPMVRFLTAMLYKSHISGLSKLHYPESKFIKDIDFGRLNVKEYGGRSEPSDVPYILYNAWNLTRKRLQLFTNKPPPVSTYAYKRVSSGSLCACSALPYIEQTVTIEGDTYCEGALRDTVNFEQLLEDHDKAEAPLKEIWINRIVDAQQIRKPQNLHDALANLCEMFGATVGEDDVKLFKCHVREAKHGTTKSKRFDGIIVEVKVDSKINFKWNHHNLEEGIKRGRLMADAAYRLYEHYGPDANGTKKKNKHGKVISMIPDDLDVDEIDGVLTQHIPEDHRQDVRDAVLAGHRDVRGTPEESHIISRLGPPSHP
jgi:predicted acylesterase/phospholipase RssA